jgi:hypothetical protein
MKFKAYDILSTLIPGFLMLFLFLYISEIKYEKDFTILYTAVAFLLGYIVHTLSSWLENAYFFSWGGRPSDRLLDGGKMWRVQCYNWSEIKEELKKETRNANASNDELFKIAMRHVNNAKAGRVQDFFNEYTFVRSLLTCLLIATPAILVVRYDFLPCYLLVPLLIIIWLRAKERAYYYVLEVLNAYSVLRWNDAHGKQTPPGKEEDD